MNRSISDLENRVMHMLLTGDDPVLISLRNQFSKAELKSRELTGVGFYTYFKISGEMPRLHSMFRLKKDFSVGDIGGKVTEPHNLSLGFVLFITDGQIDVLEGFTYGNENWTPSEREKYCLFYLNEGERDLETLRQGWNLP